MNAKPARQGRAMRLGAWSMIFLLQFQAVATAHAAVSQVPLVSGSSPDVNIMFTLDDSGSMHDNAIPDKSQADQDIVGDDFWNEQFEGRFAQMRDSYLSTSAVWRYYRSSAGNPIYYNPAIRYDPWPRPIDDRTNLPPANPAAACYGGFEVTVLPTNLPAGCVIGTNAINLRDRVVVTTPDNGLEARGYWPATYFRYKGTGALAQNGVSAQATNIVGNWDKVEIKPSVTSYAKAATRTDCVAQPNVCTYAEELQNFANWFQYYRNRALMAKGASATAFSKQGTNLRVGFARLHGPNANIDGVSTPMIQRGVRKFEGTAREQFYNLLYNTESGGFTPLRYAADLVGKYFERKGAGSPWADNPDPSKGPAGAELSCRKNFHIFTSDGYWNTDEDGALTNVGNADNFTSSLGAQYSNRAPARPNVATGPLFSNTDPDELTVDPFKDSQSMTLSDFVAYYWRRDLRTDLPNNVPESDRDPAYWQHLSTFTVGIGVSSGMSQIATQAQRDGLIANTTAVNWTDPINNGGSVRGDDFVHASMSGRGRFFLATDPRQFADSLTDAIQEALDVSFAGAGVAAESQRVSGASVIYQATFSPRRWYGRLYAFPQTATGAVDTDPTKALWEASNKMPAPSARNIFTFDTSVAPRQGRPFTWSGLNATQKAHLNNDPTLLDYLRGSDANELKNGGNFRTRARNTIGSVTGGVLGDIVNGTPLKGPDAGGDYERLPAGAESSSYAAYRTGNVLVDMRNSLYVSANDGMLHAFNTDNGVERFAYVPNAVFEVPRANSTGAAEKRLRMLSEPTYQHRYTVDGPPNVGDAFVNGAWRSVMVGTSGAGARTVFAIDVTNPTSGGSGGFGADKVMWEFSEADNPDMGYVLGSAFVVRMRNGSWAALVGNGYDSTSGRAKLFILNLATGTVLREFAVGAPGGNGLSQPNFLLNQNREVVAIYAGDLKGQVWKFDVSSTNSNDWSVAFGGAPMYRATNALGIAQPITVMPELTENTAGGVNVTFGTGKIFEVEDSNSDPAVNVNLTGQSIYGIWDKPGETSGFAGRSALLRQNITATDVITNASAQTAFDTTSSGRVDYATQRGWYIDLESGGERVHLNPRQVQRVMFVPANKPSTAACQTGGTGRLFALDPLHGEALRFTVFDTNGDNVVNSADARVNVFRFTTATITQPTYQVVDPAAPTTDLSTTKRTSVLNRGEPNAVQGGVEVTGGTSTTCTRTGGRTVISRSDTGITDLEINTCPAKGRVSWRQLR